MHTVSYGSEIVLKHAATGLFLSSPAIPHCHPGGSDQDQVTCIDAPNAKCYWLVKAANGYPEGHLYGEPVADRSVIRLENSGSRRNLHCHGHPAPVSKEQLEVTCYGKDGKGDANDDWVVEVEGNRPAGAKSKLRLVHCPTGAALHSHPTSSPQFTSGQQEVTGFRSRDDNDFWVVEAVHGPLLPPAPAVHGRTSTWLAWVHFFGSVASVSGITLLFLGSTLQSASSASLLWTILSVMLNLGIATLIVHGLRRVHRRSKVGLGPWPSLVVTSCIGVPIGCVVFVSLLWAMLKWAEPTLTQMLLDLLGGK